MQFESLKVFCDVARLQSFSRAARDNRITQSAVSQIVGQLEKRLGVLLVDRSRRPPKLTQPGRAYYDGCRRLVDEYLGVEAAVRHLDKRLAARVHGAAIYSVGLGDISRLLQRFKKARPGAEVDMEYLHPDQVYERVLDGRADFGLVSFPQTSRKLAAVAWREEEMVLACARTHPLAGRRSVRPSLLADEKLVGFDRGLPIRRQVDRYLRGHRVHPDVVLEFDNIENIKKAVEVGEGVAVLPRPTLEPETRSGRLSAVTLTEGRFVRPLAIIHRRNPGLGPAVREVVDFLCHKGKGAGR